MSYIYIWWVNVERSSNILLCGPAKKHLCKRLISEIKQQYTKHPMNKLTYITFIIRNVLSLRPLDSNQTRFPWAKKPHVQKIKSRLVNHSFSNKHNIYLIIIIDVGYVLLYVSAYRSEDPLIKNAE